MADPTLLARLLAIRTDPEGLGGQPAEEETHRETQQLHAEQQELRAALQELRAELEGLCALQPLHAPREELRAGFEEARREMQELRASQEKLHAGVEGLRVELVELSAMQPPPQAAHEEAHGPAGAEVSADLEQLQGECKALRTDLRGLRTDVDTIAKCLEPEMPSVLKTLRRERAARSGACLDAVLAQAAYGRPILAWAGLLTWSSVKRASRGVLQSAQAVGERRLFVAGGEQIKYGGEEDYLRSAESLHLQSGQWEPSLEMRFKRKAHVGGVLGGYLYICGGHSPQGRSVVRFSPAHGPHGRWNTMAPMQTSRTHAAAVVIDHQLHVCGGYEDGRNEVWSSIESFDPRGGDRGQGVWATTLEMFERREALAAVALRGNLLLCGGYDFSLEHQRPALHELGRSAELHLPASGACVLLPSMTRPRHSHAAAVWSGQVFACGGFDPGTGQVLSSVEVYDPDLEAWSESTPLSMMEPRLRCLAVVFAGGLYVFGGWRQNVPGAVALRSAERLDLATGACEALEPMELHRASFGGGVITVGPTAAG